MQPRTLIAAVLVTSTFSFAALAVPVTSFQRSHIASGTSLSAAEVVQTSDGGYAYIGTRYISSSRAEVTLTRTNSVGQPLWCSSFGIGLGRAEGVSLVQSPDGGFVLGCTTENAAIPGNRIMLIKLDSFGNPTAARAYDGLQLGRVRNASSGGYLIAGSRNAGTMSAFGPGVLIRTDANLNQVAGVSVIQPVDPNGTSTSVILSDLAENQRGDLYVTGRRDLGGMSSRSFLMNIPLTSQGLGAIQWANDYFAQHPGYGSGFGVTCAANGDAMMVARISHAPLNTFSSGVCRVNRIGGRLWGNLYTSGTNVSRITTSFTGNAIVGLELPRGIMSLDSATGNLQWARYSSQSTGEWGSGISPTSDGGYILTGSSWSSPTLFKYDNQGWIGCNMRQATPQVVASTQTVAIALATVPIGPDCQVFLSHDIVTLIDEPMCFTQRCPGDYNTDQAVDFFDYLDFVADFSSAAPRADFNEDQNIDFFDYLDFVSAFASPC